MATPAIDGDDIYTIFIKDNPLVKVAYNRPDGTVSRPPFPVSPPSDENDSAGGVFSKDVTLKPSNNTRLRIYIPRAHYHEKLPLVVFFHGGGFILFGADCSLYHVFCERMAAGLPAVVVSVDYRLAPESRLPAAYDDAMEAVYYLREAATAAGGLSPSDPLSRADFGRCFLMGSSAGGNLVYHAALRCAAAAEDLRPLRVAGLVMHQPFFGGVARTGSELEMENDPVLPLRATDMMWELSLPEGADRDHPYSNPMKAAVEGGRGGGGEGKGMTHLLPRCLLTGNVRDLLRDRQREFMGMLEAAGVTVVAGLDRDGCHAAELFFPEVADVLIADVRELISETG